ncbi:MAG: 3-oxoacyl-[acyl-carrier-protein] reductase [Holosporales bacterium]|jgi:3-oxoacyl-[acyl-carrier protein] reductase|nr:3-oxoacyl-[acyl-carrier-protein] reductase [Holosporales bacterium]
MLFSLTGYRALITGGSGAIGRATAVAMATQGANVVVTGTNVNALDATSKEVSEKTSQNVDIIRCDLADLDSASRLFHEVEGTFGQIDILVNNAGIDRDRLVMKMSEEDFQEVININLIAVFMLSKAALVAMAKRRYGRIINMSSVVGFTGNPGQANYCASKAGLVGMSKALALEYARRNITVNCVAPGAVKSPMIDALSEEAKEVFLNRIPMRYMADPMDVAYACCFLASKEASYITGQTIHVNGGMLTT